MTSRHAPRRTWTRAALLVTSVLVAGGGTWWAVPYVRGWQRRAQAREALAGFSQCMFGGGSDYSAARLRRRWIGASLEPASSNGWPSRCDTPALVLQAAVAELLAAEQRCHGPSCCVEDEPCLALAQLFSSLTALRPTLRPDRFAPELAEVIPLLARQAGLGASGVAGSTASAVPAVELYQPRRMAALHRGSAELLTDPPGGTELRLLFYDRQSRYRLCQLDLIRTPTARCGPVPSKDDHGTIGQLLAGQPGAPPRLLIPGPDRGEPQLPQVVVDATTGERLLELPDRIAGGYVWADGTTAALSSDAEGAATLYRMRPGDPEPSALAVQTPSTSAPPMVLFDQLLWTEPAGAAGHRLVAQRLAQQGELLESRLEVGETGPLAPPLELESCRTAEGLTIVLRGKPEGHHLAVAVAFRGTDGWQRPKTLTVPSAWFGLTCYDRTASLSWIDTLDEHLLDPEASPGSPIEGHYRIHRARCTGKGCRTEHADIRLERYARASRYVVGDLGTAMVVLWRSPIGDVRLRSGSLAQLARAPQRPLFDDVAHGGFAWELGRGAIFARAGKALLLVKTTVDLGAATYGFRIDATGTAVPLPVTEAKR